ncbi:MAG: BlaI/MecI/CopY family transcriptional regulator [Aureliella sp.]
MSAELTRRERQILDLLYKLGEASASDICDGLPIELANATVRTQLRILEEKGVVKHRRDGKRFLYRPAVPRKSAATSALRKVLDVFFKGSVEDALAAHLADPKTKLDAEQIERLRKLIDQFKDTERRK